MDHWSEKRKEAKLVRLTVWRSIPPVNISSRLEQIALLSCGIMSTVKLWHKDLDMPESSRRASTAQTQSFWLLEVFQQQI